MSFNNSRKAKMREFLPWVEKYRPRNINEIAHQSHVIGTLGNHLKGNYDLPHLLFYGPPGTGKTSTILALAKQLYGPKNYKQRVLELNASDERGINIVRSKIKTFAQYSVNSTNINNNNNNNNNNDAENNDPEQQYPNPPYKIIILDEADSMTRDAQTALRRTMEKYSKMTRFCLICNYVSRIIAPVASRCSKLRFHSLTDQSMLLKLTEISKNEQIKISNDTLNEIILMSCGDLRKAITLLQSSSLMKDKHELITIDDVCNVSVRVPKKIIYENVLNACQSDTFNAVADVAQYIICEGYPVSLILSNLLDFVIHDSNKYFSNLSKAEISIQIAKADRKLVDGASEFLQLLNILGLMSKHIIRSNNNNNNR